MPDGDLNSISWDIVMSKFPKSFFQIAYFPERFAKSQMVGAHFGLTPRKFSSGKIDYRGHISKCGDGLVRTAFCRAGSALFTRV